MARAFGDRSAADLELLTTSIYIDRELKAGGESAGVEMLSEMVREVKPRFPLPKIKSEAELLLSSGLLNGTLAEPE